METPPNQRRFSQPRKPLPKKNTAIMEFQAFTAVAAPKSTATGMNHMHHTQNGFSNQNQVINSALTSFQNFRLTSEGITEVVSSTPNGRRFKLTKEGIKEISSRRI